MTQHIRTLASLVCLISLPAGAAILLNRSAWANAAESAPSRLSLDQPRPLPQDRPLLELPETWIAFEGKVRVFSPDMPRVDGRVYRSSNGSFRLETGPPGELVRTIDIKNLDTDTHYLYMKDKWTSAPMQVPEWGGRRPPLRFADQPNLRPHRHKLSFLAGQEPNVFADTGLDAFEYFDAGGNVHLQAPALNMFDLVNQSLTGRREEVYDITLKEPDPALFVPPQSAIVASLSEARGMKLVPKSEHQHKK
jgi:hypothetical protein